MTFLLPYPISANRYLRHWNNRVVITSEARAYRAEVAQIAREAGVIPVDGPVALELTLHPPKPKDWNRRLAKDPSWAKMTCRRLDLGNVEKVAVDALQGVAFEDDDQITHLTVILGDPIEGGGLRVTVASDFVRTYQ